MGLSGTFHRALDQVMDRLVLPGYSRLGYLVRRRGWPADPAPDALRGRTALVTGAGAGLGKATAAGLAALGARVHLLVRNPDRGEQAMMDIASQVPGADLVLERCDVSSLREVRAFAADFAARVPALGALVHNAGVLPDRREVTAEGHELTMATHVLGPFLLTDLLRPILDPGPSCVVFVSSGGMYAHRLTVDDPEYLHGPFKGALAYARTKRMQVTLASLWGAELRETGIAVHGMHPGWADTPGLAASLPRFRQLLQPALRTQDQGADTIVWLAAADRAATGTGQFWHDRRARPTYYLPWLRDAPAARLQLWDLCRRATGPL